ncbi:hypothetical protein DPMN_111648 [Dreissena polymorpha]|uniref:Uncharacterized protein n=1 Tax=Dreissena polymorpha TaxID=45954 RepID=A0A9D4KEV1_DREPO|nr:hypothetical protein DPMN_111648 [Dreissena polymorpha]
MESPLNYLLKENVEQDWREQTSLTDANFCPEEVPSSPLGSTALMVLPYSS